MHQTGIFEEQARCISNRQLAPRLFLMELESPQIAHALQPGQFVHMNIPASPQRILRRPFSVFKADAVQGSMSILYQVVGAGTEDISHMATGQTVSLLGPIGNTWSLHDKPCLLVGAGVGAAPLYLQAKRMAQVGVPVQVVLGSQTKEALVTYSDYCAIEGAEVVAATDDGSFGFSGFCTVPAQEAIATGDFAHVAVCGPEPVMRIVSAAALEAGCTCEVSLERRMACGVGACLSCVVDTSEGKKRCCVDGPIFDASEVVW